MTIDQEIYYLEREIKKLQDELELLKACKDESND